MSKKIMNFFFLSVGVFSVFLIGYLMGRYDDNIFENAIKEDNYNSQLVEDLGETKPTMVNLNNYEIVGDSVIEFRIKCADNKWRIERIESLSCLGLDGATISEINAMYGNLGYVIREVNSNKIVVERNSAKYYPNKYVIAMENGDLIICKSGENGEIFDLNGEYINQDEYGNTGINIKVYEIEDDYIIKIITGSEEIQFNTIDEALAKVTEIIESNKLPYKNLE